jgi:Asp-tRNA(Asn)/Glu-tRNA(Gln) amidotransferase B subunit
MRVAVLGILILSFVFVGCQENKKDVVHLMGAKKSSYIYNLSSENEKNRENRVKISNIDSKAKIEIAKIEAENKALIAKLEATTSKEVAKTDATTRIQTAVIDSSVKKEGIKSSTYISIAIIILLIIALFIFYFNSRKNRELTSKLNKEQIDKDILIHERELTEKRFHKILDLVGEGKLSEEVEQDVIKSLTTSTVTATKIIEHK